MAYAAVFWMKQKTWSIIDTSTIEVGDHKVGSSAYANWKGKLQEVKILRLSESFDELKSLKVSPDGCVREFGMSNALSDKASTSANTGKKGKQSKSNPKTKTASSMSKELKPIYDDAALVDHDLEPDETASKDTVDVSNQDCFARVKSPAKSGPVDSGSQLTDENSSKSSNVAAVVLPPASPEIIHYFETITSALKNQGNGVNVTFSPELGKRGLSSQPTKNDSPLKDCKVQLLPGHDVMISRRKRNTITKLNKADPEQMVRDLLLAIVGVEKLRSMKARNKKGKSNFTPIPKEIMTEIEEFTALYAKPPLMKTKVTKVTNNLCDSLRKPDRCRMLSSPEEGKPTQKGNKKSSGPSTSEAASTSSIKGADDSDDSSDGEDLSDSNKSDGEASKSSRAVKSLSFSTPSKSKTLSPDKTKRLTPGKHNASPSGNLQVRSALSKSPGGLPDQTPSKLGNTNIPASPGSAHLKSSAEYQELGMPAGSPAKSYQGFGHSGHPGAVFSHEQFSPGKSYHEMQAPNSVRQSPRKPANNFFHGMGNGSYGQSWGPNFYPPSYPAHYNQTQMNANAGPYNWNAPYPPHPPFNPNNPFPPPDPNLSNMYN